MGEVVGGYQVTAKLGEGGMGVVYLAQHTIMGRKAVVKVLRPQLSSNQEMVQRFFNEARAAAAISHPGIVSVFDLGQRADGSAYIVMDFLEGESLASRLHRCGRLESKEAMAITRQILSALSAAHAQGIVHRDLKPDNIFIVPDSELPSGERIKLLDFGIAKLQGDAGPGALTTRAGALMGTPVYMSPEQCRGAGHCDERADLYSVGVMLFELLTGSPPFAGKGAGDLMAAHLRDAPPKLRDRVGGLSQGLEEVVATLLAKSPADRYQSGAAAMEQLDTLLEGGTDQENTAALSHPRPTDPWAATLVGAASPHQNSGTTLRNSAGSIDLAEDSVPPGKRRFLLGVSLALAGFGAAATLMAMRSSEQSVVVSSLATSDADVADVERVNVADVERVDVADVERVDAAAQALVPVMRPTPLADALPVLSFAVLGAEQSSRAKRLNKRGQRLRREDKIEEALADFAEAMHQDPGHILSRYNYACMLNVQGEAHEAFAILQQFQEAGCPQCLGRLIRARSDSDWKSSWDHPDFIALTQRVRLEQPSLQESGILLARAIRDGAFEEAADLFAPREVIAVRIAPKGCKSRGCRETHKLQGQESVRSLLQELVLRAGAGAEVGEQRCQRSCCTYALNSDAALQLSKACTELDTGAVRSLSSLEFVTHDDSEQLE